jgi:DNA-binding CsgD family transcriptional regulator
LSVKTIETYRAHIKEKLDLEDASALLTYAIQWINSQDKG